MRDDDLLRIRPAVSAQTEGTRGVEAFLHRTLRPVLKLQNPLILKLVAAQIRRYGIPFAQRPATEQAAEVRKLVKDDGRLKHTLMGLVAGHFTEEEFAFHLAHEAEVRRRLTALLVQRVTDQLGAVAGAVVSGGAEEE